MQILKSYISCEQMITILSNNTCNFTTNQNLYFSLAISIMFDKICKKTKHGGLFLCFFR